VIAQLPPLLRLFRVDIDAIPRGLALHCKKKSSDPTISLSRK
jgi:hypothetical protein